MTNLYERQIDNSVIDGKGYLLTRTHAASCRLNLQHYLWQSSIGYLLHPSIPTTSSSSPTASPPTLPTTFKLADIACGTAIWLTEISAQFPQASLDGYDIDLSQAPHSSWLPSNVTLKEWDILQDPPSELHGIYDIIHIRLVVLVIENGDPRAVIRRLYKLLKPGGWIQWDELNPRDCCVKKPSSSPSHSYSNDSNDEEEIKTPALDKLIQMSKAVGKHDWTTRIPSFLEECGFINTEMKFFDDKREMVRVWHEQHMLTMEELMLSFQTRGNQEAAERMGKLIDIAGQEAAKGAAMCFPRLVCVAKKPEI